MYATQIAWLPLTSSGILVLPSHRRFLGVLSDASAPHHEEAFVAPYVHFRRFTSNCDHTGHAWDFDRGSTEGSSGGSSEGEPFVWELQSAVPAQVAPTPLEGNPVLRRREVHRARDDLSPFTGSSAELLSEGRESRCHSHRSRRRMNTRGLRRLLATQRKRLNSVGLDSRLHDHLEAKCFSQPLEMLRRLQRSPPSWWASSADLKRWMSKEANKRPHSRTEGVLAGRASAGGSLILSWFFG